MICRVLDGIIIMVGVSEGRFFLLESDLWGSLHLSQSDVSIPVFDTTLIHAERAAELAMEEETENRPLSPER